RLASASAASPPSIKESMSEKWSGGGFPLDPDAARRSAMVERSSSSAPTRASPLVVWNVTSFTASLLDDRHGACPAGRCRFDFHRKARNGKSEGRKLLEIMQLLHVRVADLAAGFVPFPEQTPVFRLCKFLCGVFE